MARQSRFRQMAPARAPRRVADWGIGPEGVVQRAASGSVLFPNGAQPVVPEPTLVRTRGHVLLFLSSAVGVADGFDGAVGIGMVTDKAFAAGIASMPTPITDLGWEGWLWHSFFSVKAVGAQSTVTTAAIQRITIDSKAMRKTGDEMVWFAALEATEGGEAVLNASLNCRLLLKLS